MYKPRGEQPGVRSPVEAGEVARVASRRRATCIGGFTTLGMTVIKHSFGTHPSATPPPSLQREGKKKYVFASIPS